MSYKSSLVLVLAPMSTLSQTAADTPVGNVKGCLSKSVERVSIFVGDINSLLEEALKREIFQYTVLAHPQMSTPCLYRQSSCTKMYQS